MAKRKSKKASKKKTKKTSKKATKKRAKKKNAKKVDDVPVVRLDSFFANLGGGGRMAKTSPLDEAQQIMYDAWEAPTCRKAVALAKKALKVSADCADAYTFLADYDASWDDEALELYQKGVEAGKRALGARAFKEDVGYFWGLLETRPYMRALAGLARNLWNVGRHDEAIGHYRELLRLNPNDNQGIRDLLMAALLQLDRNDEAEELFKQYKNGCMAVWMYSRVLLDFRAKGDTPVAGKSLKAALEENRNVPAYLTGRKSMPRELPGHYGFGDDNEAILYVHENKAAWEATPGALEWLASKAK